MPPEPGTPQSPNCWLYSGELMIWSTIAFIPLRPACVAQFRAPPASGRRARIWRDTGAGARQRPLSGAAGVGLAAQDMAVHGADRTDVRHFLARFGPPEPLRVFIRQRN